MDQTILPTRQRTMFEDDYLIRSLGSIAQKSDVALTELLANSWDAGASIVKIDIPDEDEEQKLTVEDDGCGMTPEQFKHRWMTLGYNRVRHQGPMCEFPPERQEWKRKAYGRSGVGRHGMFCFADEYKVSTWRNGKGGEFTLCIACGDEPFSLTNERIYEAQGHGTRIEAYLERNRPDAERIRDILSARFLHDPKFKVLVNGESIPLTKHPGLIKEEIIEVGDSIKLKAFVIDSIQAARTMQKQGIAFWVGGRLVGEPTWTLGQKTIIDGRTRFAKRYTVVIQSDDLFDELWPDWSGFKPTEKVDLVFDAVGEYVQRVFREVSAGQIKDTKEAVFREHRKDIEKLKPLARIELSEFLDNMVEGLPTFQPEVLSHAVKAAIRLEKTRSGEALLEKLSSLSEEDIEGLNRLLNDWTVRDAMAVLDVIDRRIAVIEAISKLSVEDKVDELNTLHPLVTQARWLFGPEFDTPEYTSNVSLVNAVKHIFNIKDSARAFVNPKNRPDLVILKDSTLSVVSIDRMENDSGLSVTQSILIIELKKGKSTIGRKEMYQANGYVTDFLKSGLLDGDPYVKAFVVGYKIGDRIDPVSTIGSPERGKIQAATYGQLVRTAEKRMFNLRQRLSDRYDDISGGELLNKVLKEPEQLTLL